MNEFTPLVVLHKALESVGVHGFASLQWWRDLLARWLEPRRSKGSLQLGPRVEQSFPLVATAAHHRLGKAFKGSFRGEPHLG